ncbi:jg12092, partial [Pararge aegeria aegeria]
MGSFSVVFVNCRPKGMSQCNVPELLLLQRWNN